MVIVTTSDDIFMGYLVHLAQLDPYEDKYGNMITGDEMSLGNLN